MHVVDEYSQQLMLKFLQQNFPVKRLKDGRRFRRGIVADSGFSGFTGPYTPRYFLSPQNELNNTGIYLSKVLDDVFAFPKLEINMAILKYLNVI